MNLDVPWPLLVRVKPTNDASSVGDPCPSDAPLRHGTCASAATRGQAPDGVLLWELAGDRIDERRNSNQTMHITNIVELVHVQCRWMLLVRVFKS